MPVRILGLIVATGLLATLYACGGVTDVAMTPTGCVPVLSPTSQHAIAGGGAFALSVTVARNCEWRAAADADWVVVTQASGSGSGSAAYTVASNTTATPRVARITVGDQSVRVTQSPADCSYSLTPSSATVGADGGRVEFQLATNAGCTWTASTTNTWLSVTTPDGTGPGTVSATVSANPENSPRGGSIDVAGQTFTVSQDGISCSFDVSPLDHTIGPNGGAVTARINAGDDACAWAARAGAEWIRVEPQNGRGSGTIGITASPNDRNEPRHATVDVGGRSIRISQQAECGVTLSSSAISVAAEGGAATVSVTTGPGCTWRAQGVPPWMTVTPNVGTGSAAVTVTVAPSSAESGRTGTFRIGDQSITVMQGGVACVITLIPAAAPEPVVAAGGEGEFRISAPAGCAWSATSLNDWIRTSSTGSGDGIVRFAFNPNLSTTPRPGGVKVGDKTFTFTQAGSPEPCTFAVTWMDTSEGEAVELPWTGLVGASGRGDVIRVNVRTRADCRWTSSAVPDRWIRGLGTERVGSGFLDLELSCNDEHDVRTASVTVAGHTARVQQGAPAECGSVDLAGSLRRRSIQH
jgi:hypothetical protein